ncbi:MAG: MaoC family dehydratase N-terminal domain-containing protein [Burkholderiales bacterium]|nr:MaoC family dehydratase N-terminal domain-containing protein [Burkholderiales bacterium]
MKETHPPTSTGRSSTALLDESQQSPGLTEATIEKARSLIGVWLRRDVHMPSLYEPISPHDIRRWAHYSVGDDNPLFSDMQYARRTPWGSIIAPPTFLYTIDSGIVAPGLPGIQWIFAGSRWRHFHPVRAGDTIAARARVIDVQVREGKTVPKYVNQVGEVLFTNQNGALVSRYEGDIFRIPRAASGGGFKFKEKREDRLSVRYSREQIEQIAAAYRNEERRGAEPRYWEDVSIGDELPVVYKGPLTLVDIVGFYSGRRTVYNVLKLAFAERDRHPANAYYSPTTGVPMHPAAGHFDVDIALGVGMPGAYDQGWMRINWAGHLLTNWCGDMGFVRELNGRTTKPNLVGDLTKYSGEVTGKRKEDGEALVTIEWRGTNQRAEVNCNGTAVARLPSRDISLPS